MVKSSSKQAKPNSNRSVEVAKFGSNDRTSRPSSDHISSAELGSTDLKSLQI